MAELKFELHSPLTEEEWDLITDVDLDHTPSVMFHTKHGKDVEYVKVVWCKDCKYSVSEQRVDALDIYTCYRTSSTMVGEHCRATDFCSWGERKEKVENG